MKTNWTPKKKRGTPFRTHEMVEISADRVEFLASGSAWMFSLIFIVPGSCLLLFIAAGFLFNIFPMDGDVTIVCGSLGLLLSGIGGVAFLIITNPIVFDKRSGFFWMGRVSPSEVPNIRCLKNAAELEQIHALQLVSEYCSGKNSYYSYELNLVLENGDRINVVDHGDQGKIRKDAEKLAYFLEKPIWDAISVD